MAEDTTPDVDTTDDDTDTPPDAVTAAPEAVKPPVPTPADIAPDQPAKPPTVSRAEFDKLAKDLRVATREAIERKQRIAELEAATASDAEKAVLQARKEASEATAATWKPAVVTARAEAALASAGCTDPEKQELMLRLIDQSTVELDDKGKVIGGLTEQVDVIKDKFPEAFAAARPARVPSAREVDAGNKTVPPKKITATDRLVANLTGVKP